MKKQFVRFALLFVFAFGGAKAHGENVESPEVKARLEQILSRVETREFRPFYEFMFGLFLAKGGDLYDLRVRLNDYSNHDVYISSATKRDIGVRLMRIYSHTKSKSTKRDIIEILTMYGDKRDPEVIEFIMSRLSSPEQEEMDTAWGALCFTEVQDNAVYDKVTDLVRAGKLSEKKSLIAKMRMNLSRAREEAYAFLRKTPNVLDFQQIADNLCHREDMGGIQIAIDRSKAEQNQSYACSIERKCRIKYLESCEGAKFREAMKAISEGFSNDTEIFPMLEVKIKSKDRVTRETVVSYLEQRLNAYPQHLPVNDVSVKLIIDMLSAMEKLEPNADMKLKIGNLIQKASKLKWAA
ncbi:MAG: hypothetical protein A2049_13195 [Elusimicrobia bacterium GWA2_62_23]|nr:MAG: hypothetical protein A2049_13195 [Elusimicrobia bacterium GWA2_62_23]